MLNELREATPFLQQIDAKSLDFQKYKCPAVEFCNRAVVSVPVVKVGCSANAMFDS